MWKGLPLWVRAVVSGLIVAGIPTIVWGVLANVNTMTFPMPSASSKAVTISA